MAILNHQPAKAHFRVYQGLCSAFNFLTETASNWVGTAKQHYEAAEMYEELARLSDAELKWRGLSRDSIARHVVEAASGTSHIDGPTSAT